MQAAYVRYLKRKGGAPLMGYLIPALMADPPYEIDEEAADKAAEDSGVDISAAAGDASSDAGTSSSSSRSAGAASGGGKKNRARLVHTIVPSPLGIDCLYFVPAPYQDDIRTFGFVGWKHTGASVRRLPSYARLALHCHSRRVVTHPITLCSGRGWRDR